MVELNKIIELKNAITGATARSYNDLLFSLILKADLKNIKLLKKIYPEEVEMVEHWRKTGSIEEI